MMRFLRFTLLTLASLCARLALKGTGTRHVSFRRRAGGGVDVTALDDFTHEDYQRALRHGGRVVTSTKKDAPSDQDAPPVGSAQRRCVATSIAFNK